MKKLIASLLTLAALCSFPLQASAAETTEARVPVTLTVINTQHPISVTVPAALPVSVIDGSVLTATNAKIVNNAKAGAVKVTGVLVESGDLTVDNFDAFGSKENAIALCINGCATAGPGELTISPLSFPDISAGENLSIDYQAKVSVTKEVKDATAATVIFTIAAAE